MLVPYEWLREFVPGLPPAGEVARELTMAGVAVEAVIGEGEATVFDFEITHNRPDLLSVFGIAREAAAVFSLPLRHPTIVVPEEGRAAHDMAGLEIAAPDLCRRYIARIITDVSIRPSPAWMQARLLAAGVRPINNIVDVTNYVMLEIGQPLHAFDLDRLEGRRVVVRRAAPGERLITIDGEERVLSEEMLVIADACRPVAVAGVMGGLETEVSDGTSAVLLESANFDGVSVWRTSRALRMRTEASSRFSRGLWPENARIGVDRAAALIAAVGAGRVAAGMLDAYPRREENAWVPLRPGRVNHLLGTAIPPEEMKDILMRLGFVVESHGRDAYRVLVPEHRLDVSREEDLVEEIARLYGYDKIEATLPKGAPPEAQPQPGRQLAARAGEILRACGLSEVETISFTNFESCRKLRIPEELIGRSVRISNPLSSDYTIMRTTLLTSLVDVLQRNAARREDDVAIYEIAKVYLRREGEAAADAVSEDRRPRLPVEGGERGADESLLPCEPTKIGLAVMGRMAESSWERGGADAGFFDLKGIVEALLESLGLRDPRFVATAHPSLHPGRAARVVAAPARAREASERKSSDGNATAVVDIGYLGELHPEIQEAFGLRKRAYVAELDLAAILAARERARRVEPLGRFPAVARDMAVIVRQDIPCQEVLDVMKTAGRGLAEDVKLFDVYEGPQVPEGHRSLAFSITYRSPDRTLTDSEVDMAHADIASALSRRLGATVRE